MVLQPPVAYCLFKDIALHVSLKRLGGAAAAGRLMPKDIVLHMPLKMLGGAAAAGRLLPL